MTRVISYSFAPGGLGYLGGSSPVSLSWASTYPEAAKLDLVRGIQKWEDYADLIFVEIADNGSTWAANSHGDWHLRLIVSPWDGLGSTIAFAQQWSSSPGVDCAIIFDSVDGQWTSDPTSWRAEGMHEAGHNIIGLAHKDDFMNVMYPYITGNTNVDSDQNATAVSRYGTPKTAAQKYNTGIGRTANFYLACFNRLPDGGGLKYWTGQIDAGVNGGDIGNYFISLPDSQALHASRSNESFVSWLYSAVLGRTPSSSEVSYWAGQINSGVKTRGQVTADFVYSTEAANVLASRYPNGWWKV